MLTPSPASQQAEGVPRLLVRDSPEAAPVLDVDKAIEEIRSVPTAVLHRSAAFTWGARAMASYRVCVATADLEECLRHFYLGEQYREAALAHSAMGEDWQRLCAEVTAAMAEDRGRAFEVVRRRSGEVGRRPRTRHRRAQAEGS